MYGNTKEFDNRHNEYGGLFNEDTGGNIENAPPSINQQNKLNNCKVTYM